jgi:hypothetical protein
MVNDNGKRKKITMFEAITKQAVRKAVPSQNLIRARDTEFSRGSS